MNTPGIWPKFCFSKTCWQSKTSRCIRHRRVALDNGERSRQRRAILRECRGNHSLNGLCVTFFMLKTWDSCMKKLSYPTELSWIGCEYTIGESITTTYKNNLMNIWKYWNISRQVYVGQEKLFAEETGQKFRTTKWSVVFILCTAW